MLNKIIKYFLENRLITYLLLGTLVLWGLSTAPFNWESDILPRDPVAVDAIPDIGENQQIVYTEWMGQSPQDIDDQITYPLTTALLGVPGIKTIRSNSIFGLSSIYVIFEDDVDFYWSRTRILEKLNSLPAGILPEGVTPALGPDATALGQVYWYTLEGRDPKTGKPTGGWDPQELRSIQDFYVRYYLTAAKGVSEVASIGGYVKEYQIDIDPNSMKAHGVTIGQVINAVKESNLDIGARTIEFNRVEYLVRGLGYIENLEDLEESVVATKDNTPIRLKDVADIHFGPATRRGGLDKNGVEAVGGVVVTRYGSNPLEVINNIKAKIKEVESGLPSKILEDGTVSKICIVPFYDRSGLINETLGTLESSLTHEIIISIIVIIVLILNLKASLLISSLLPVGVLMTFISMRYLGVDANIVALSGIAIAIGVMVDVGVVFTESIIQHLELPENLGARGKQLVTVIYNAVTEVASAVITALATTIVSFLPVFAMQAAEGKLFGPLAFTKTFALISALIIGIFIIPTLAYTIFNIRPNKKLLSTLWNSILIISGLVLSIIFSNFLALALIAFGLNNIIAQYRSESWKKVSKIVNIIVIVLTISYFLTIEWMPLGAHKSTFVNYIFVIAVIGIVLGFLYSIVYFYVRILTWCLSHKWLFLSIPMFTILFGITSWQGFDKVFGFVATGGEIVGLDIRSTNSWKYLDEELFPGIGKEFMPSLDEGSFLFMPTTMPHSGIEENVNMIQDLDLHLSSIPEVDNSVGKWGRVSSALDPAPISMYENVINYKPEYILDEDGHRIRFRVNKEGAFMLKDGGTFNYNDEEYKVIKLSNLIIDKKGEYFRQWRKHINSPDDIWDEIVKHSKFPGLTSAPKLQPIETRLVMLQTGMRAPMGIKVFGPSLDAIGEAGIEIEKWLKKVKSVDSTTVFADRVIGKPYLEIDIDREAIARYGLTIKDVQMYLGVAVGGKQLSSTVEGRERYPIRVRYARELRDNPEDLKSILIPTSSGAQIPLGSIASIEYVRGPQMIRSEDTFLMSFVIFDKVSGKAEVDVVEEAQEYLNSKIKSGELMLPEGVTFRFTGNYENQLRATKRLALVIPISLVVIFLILYFQFRSVITTTMIFTGIIVAFSGGFIMLWLYGMDGFMDVSIAEMSMRDMFQIKPINLSVAVWVGFIALFGIATDDGVLIGTYLKQTFEKEKPKTIEQVRNAVIHAGSKRVRPAILTTATTIIALIPVLTSTGKGSDIMVPMAIPSFGGMVIAIMTMFVIPVLYSMWQEAIVKRSNKKEIQEVPKTKILKDEN